MNVSLPAVIKSDIVCAPGRGMVRIEDSASTEISFDGSRGSLRINKILESSSL